MTVEVHPATDSDAAAISELNGVVHDKHLKAVPWMFKPGAWTPDMVRSILGQPNNLVFVATVAGEPAGYIYAETRKFPETSLTHAYESTHIHHLSVHTRHRRSGVASALVDAVERAASERGVERMTADVWAFNDEALRFFKRRGLSPYMLRHWR